jgi:urease accessory protein
LFKTKYGEQLSKTAQSETPAGIFYKCMKNSFKISRLLLKALVLFPIVLLPSLAQAHPGWPGHTHGFANGLAHPLTGLDHILAMVAVGLWAAQRGGRALWAVPLAFVSVMALGGIFGLMGGALPFVETGIATSVLVLGVLIAASVRLPLLMSVLIVGLFALFHGYAHGAEMPATASGLDYGMGFILATVSLHLAGIGLGLTVRRWGSMQLIRCAGCAIAICGAFLFFMA